MPSLRIKSKKEMRLKKKRISKIQKKAIVKHLWNKRRFMLIKANSNFIFNRKSSLLIETCSQDAYMAEEPSLIINDQKEPLLRAFENFAARRAVGEQNKFNLNLKSQKE